MELWFGVPIFCVSIPYNYVSKIPKSKKNENIFNYFLTRLGRLETGIPPDASQLPAKARRLRPKANGRLAEAIVLRLKASGLPAEADWLLSKADGLPTKAGWLLLEA
ncbi:MAG TPA: hypothetical protein VF492_10915 [Verrucomicrobiae bacterium]